MNMFQNDHFRTAKESYFEITFEDSFHVFIWLYANFDSNYLLN